MAKGTEAAPETAKDAEGAATAEAAAPAAGRWHRTDPRVLLVRCGWLVPPLASTGCAHLATGGHLPDGARLTLGALLAGFAAVTLAGWLRWARSGYRLTDRALETRTGRLVRRSRSVPLHRVRIVDLTAGPAHRLLGITTLRAGATASPADGLVLDALPRERARRLRAALLAARCADGAPDEDGDTLLAGPDWRWLRFAPLTFWVFGGVLTAAGTVYRVLDGMGVEPWRLPLVRETFERFGHRALWVTVPAALCLVVLLGSAGAVALYGENWWRLRVTRSGPRALRISRGLLTTRSVTVERGRLHGVVLREPLLLRAAGGATASAVAGGLGDREENRSRSALLPPAPRPVAERLAGQVLGTHFPGTQEVAAITASAPRAAFGRRLRRGLYAAVLPGALVAAAGALAFGPALWHAVWAWTVAASVVTAALARDAYRALGHGLHGGFAVLRSGTFSRDTVLLERSAVIAWTFSGGPSARRAGLVTLTAAVAGGKQGYRVPDIPADRAAAWAAAATPGVLEEFLVPAPAEPDRPVPAAGPGHGAR